MSREAHAAMPAAAPESATLGAGRSSLAAGEPLLRVEGLRVVFPATGGEARDVAVVDGLDLELRQGECVGLVGESGAGKSLTALALLRLVPPPGRIVSGRVLLDGQDLLALPESALRRVRGGRIAMVFQEPLAALHPLFTIGAQLVATLRAHRRMARSEARAEALRLLELVAMPDPQQRLRSHPHQLSGGQRQRAMLAIALASRPDVLIADEPTTALDVTIQAQILELLERLRRELGLALLLITHDLAVVAQSCDRVCVLYAGRAVEDAAVDRLFAAPAHPYTRGLLAALPRLGAPARRGELPALPGRVPDPEHRPAGCPFHPRCPDAMARCRHEEPPVERVAPGHLARCLLAHEISRRGGALLP